MLLVLLGETQEKGVQASSGNICSDNFCCLKFPKHCLRSQVSIMYNIRDRKIFIIKCSWMFLTYNRELKSLSEEPQIVSAGRHVGKLVLFM